MQTKFKLIIFSVIFPLICAFSCNSPTVTGSLDSCVTSQKFQVSKCGKRIIDYKQKREVVGEWEDVSKLEIKPISDTPDQVCFSLDNWLTKVKPTLKEGSDFFHNQKSKNIVNPNLNDFTHDKVNDSDL